MARVVKPLNCLKQGKRIWSYEPSFPRAAGANEGEIAGFGRIERPRDEGSERFRNPGSQMRLPLNCLKIESD
jgi:hypothetical protein